MGYHAMSLVTWFLTFLNNVATAKLSNVLDISILEEETTMLSQHIIDQLFRDMVSYPRRRDISATLQLKT
jgi:hypothetical protein